MEKLNMNKMKIKQILNIIIIITIIIITIIMILVYIYNNIYIKPLDYNKKIYSVLIINSTGQDVENIIISYSHSPYDVPVVCEHIVKLSKDEKKKINIPTDIEQYGSYNVYIDIETVNGIKSADVGYFGTNTGGFSVIELNNLSGELFIHRINENTHKYKKLYRKHLKNQLSV